MPRFWVLAAVRNEAERAPKLCEALRQLDYPAKQVVIADDASDDDTLDLVRGNGDQDWSILPSRTSNQQGKAAVLRAAADHHGIAGDDLILVIDADHTLPPTALQDLVPWFTDPQVQAVAFAHRSRTPDRTLVSVYCALEGAVSEEVTNRGRSALGLGVSLTGTWACRAAAFHQHYPDGFPLVDDAVFASRLHADGWKVQLATNVASTHDVPTTVAGYLRQHIRWAGGLYGLTRAQAGQMLKNKPTSLASRLDWLIASAGYAERPAALLWLVASIALWATGNGQLTLLLIPPVVTAVTVALQLVIALRQVTASARMWLLTPPALVTMAAADVLASTAGVFGTVVRRIGWRGPSQGQVRSK